MKWTKEDIKKLKKMYKSSSEDILVREFKRPWKTIQAKGEDLGVKRNFMNDAVWTKEKTDLLKKVYTNANSWEYIFKKLGIYKKSAIQQRASKMGILLEYWTESEDTFLKENYSVLPIEDIESYLGKSKISVYGRASLLKIKKINSWVAFSNDDLLNMMKDKIAEIGRVPQGRELPELKLPSSITLSKRFGSYQSMLNQLGYTDGSSMYSKGGYSKDGLWNRSQSEIRISNFLYDKKVNYSREVYYRDLIPDIKRAISLDWYLDDYKVFVEFFGLTEKKEYMTKVTDKIKLSKKHGFTLIEIYPKDLRNNRLDEIFFPYIK
jgi:hypothetical protein